MSDCICADSPTQAFDLFQQASELERVQRELGEDASMEVDPDKSVFGGLQRATMEALRSAQESIQGTGLLAPGGTQPLVGAAPATPSRKSLEARSETPGKEPKSRRTSGSTEGGQAPAEGENLAGLAAPPPAGGGMGSNYVGPGGPSIPFQPAPFDFQQLLHAMRLNSEAMAMGFAEQNKNMKSIDDKIQPLLARTEALNQRMTAVEAKIDDSVTMKDLQESEARLKESLKAELRDDMAKGFEDLKKEHGAKAVHDFGTGHLARNQMRQENFERAADLFEPELIFVRGWSSFEAPVSWERPRVEALSQLILPQLDEHMRAAMQPMIGEESSRLTYKIFGGGELCRRARTAVEKALHQLCLAGKIPLLPRLTVGIQARPEEREKRAEIGAMAEHLKEFVKGEDLNGKKVNIAWLVPPILKIGVVNVGKYLSENGGPPTFQWLPKNLARCLPGRSAEQVDEFINSTRDA